MDRKEFIKHSSLACGSFLILGPLLGQEQQTRPDPLDGKLVQTFVRNGHFDLPAVKQMLEETPTLLNATWDWGGGDFETALGGASHMGEREIAKFLIDKGARMDIFCAAMMGNLEIVKSMASLHPSVLHSKGPHGITLLMHAQKGGEEAKNVVEYLTSKGIKK